MTFLLALALSACSPEAKRVRDGGPGADPGNKTVVAVPPARPAAADTTLWPGRNPAPVDRQARGELRAAVVPATPAAPASQQRAFDKGTAADPRRP